MAKIRACREKYLASRGELTGEDKEWYVNVCLRPEEWARKRSLVLRRDNYLCQGCLEAEATEVHHTTYERIKKGKAEELFDDLVSYCPSCHARRHWL